MGQPTTEAEARKQVIAYNRDRKRLRKAYERALQTLAAEQIAITQNVQQRYTARRTPIEEQQRARLDSLQEQYDRARTLREFDAISTQRQELHARHSEQMAGIGDQEEQELQKINVQFLGVADDLDALYEDAKKLLDEFGLRPALAKLKEFRRKRDEDESE